MMLQLHLITQGASPCQTAIDVQHGQACTQRCALFGGSTLQGWRCACCAHLRRVLPACCAFLSVQQRTQPASTHLLHCRLVIDPPHLGCCRPLHQSSPPSPDAGHSTNPAGHATAGQHAPSAPSALLQDTPPAQAIFPAVGQSTTSPIDALLQPQQCQGNVAGHCASPAISCCCRPT